LHSSKPVDVDLLIESLGRVPRDLKKLLVQYTGSSRINVTQADELLMSLFLRAPGRSQPRSLPPANDAVLTPEFAVPDWGGAEQTYGLDEAAEPRRDDLKEAMAAVVAPRPPRDVPEWLVESELPAAFAPEVPPRNTTDPGFDRVDTDQGVAPFQNVYNALEELRTASSRPPPPTAADDSRSGSEFGAGLFTHRMDATELRRSSIPPLERRNTPFPSGVPGATELPDIRPSSRPPATTEPAPPSAASHMLHDAEDSFEILVDEEILELEPDDLLEDTNS
jgi:hypothetical protein